MSKLVSIVVPIFNVKKYIVKCVDSILSQSYENLEIILVDDGSTDGCSDYVDYYAKKDNRVIALHKSNGGLSDARNAGIDIHHGEYLFFVDADDYIHSKTIEIMMKIADKTDADIVECDFLSVSENEKLEIKRQINADKYYVFSHSQAIERMLTYQIKIMAWNKLYKSKLFKEIRYPVGKIHEDEFTTPYLVDMCSKYAYLEEPLYFYVQRSNSIMNRKFNDSRLDLIEAQESKINYFNNKYNRKYDIEMHYRFYVSLISLKVIMGEKYKGSIVQTKVKDNCFYLLSNSSDFKIKMKVVMYYLFSKQLIKRLEKG